MTEQKKRGRPRKNPVAEAPKKRGRPAGTRVKHVLTVESVRNEWEHRFDEATTYLNNVIADLSKDNKELIESINNLRHQAIGYRAVISFLESKIEQLIANSVRGN